MRPAALKLQPTARLSPTPPSAKVKGVLAAGKALAALRPRAAQLLQGSLDCSAVGTDIAAAAARGGRVGRICRQRGRLLAKVAQHGGAPAAGGEAPLHDLHTDRGRRMLGIPVSNAQEGRSRASGACPAKISGVPCRRVGAWPAPPLAGPHLAKLLQLPGPLVAPAAAAAAPTAVLGRPLIALAQHKLCGGGRWRGAAACACQRQPHLVPAAA